MHALGTQSKEQLNPTGLRKDHSRPDIWPMVLNEEAFNREKWEKGFPGQETAGAKNLIFIWF